MSKKSKKLYTPKTGAFANIATIEKAQLGGAFSNHAFDDLRFTEITESQLDKDFIDALKLTQNLLADDEQQFLRRIENTTAPITTPTTLGKMVREKRKELKLSQQEFADMSGVGRRFISELERGKPTLEFGLVLQVCEAAGIDIMAKPK